MIAEIIEAAAELFAISLFALCLLLAAAVYIGVLV